MQRSAELAVPSPMGSRQPSSHGRSVPASARLTLPEDDENEEDSEDVPKEVDSNYSDPLGPMPERPKTSAGTRINPEDEFADEEIGDDLLPE